jgi:hypothetical protein
MIALASGFILVDLLGVFHHLALRALRGLARPVERRPNITILTAFLGLLVIHTMEIIAFAPAFRLILEIPGMGSLSLEDGPVVWVDLVYYSGINFTTVGYTEITAAGPLRLISMMQSLGGFMVLTWSATFPYSIWREALAAK